MSYAIDGYEIVPALVPNHLVYDVRRFLEGCEQTDEQGQFPASVRLHPIMRVVAMYLDKRPVLNNFLRSQKLRCHWPPMARRVNPGDVRALWPLHRDTEYNAHIEGDFLSVWFPLVPIDEACGGLVVLDPFRELVPLRPGDAVILSKDCLHASMPNLSARPRLSCDFRFFGEGTRSTKHYLDLQTGEVVAP